jgi:hypothetical protein
MKLLIAKIWLGILGLAFISLVIFTITQIPIEFWLALGLMSGMGFVIWFTMWSIDQFPDVDENFGEDKKTS